MKSYTDIEQSRKLAEILPLESADMYWFRHDTETPKIYQKDMMKDSVCVNLPCWSLAALLNVLRTFTTPTAFSVKVSAPTLIKTENGYKLTYTGDYTPMINNGSDVEAPIESIADNPIDACYEMILKLHELKLL